MDDQGNERPEPPVRSDFRHFRTIPTRWMDNDVYGHLNNVVHYSMIDTTVNAWLMEMGHLDPASSPLIGLVVRSGCRYHAELGFPRPVEAGLRVLHVGSSSVRYEVGLFEPGAECAAAVGFLVHVYVTRDARRPAPISNSMREALKMLT